MSQIAPQIRYSQYAVNDLQRLADFLNSVAPDKVDSAINTILAKINMLVDMPMLGIAIPNEKIPSLRKLTISYGKNGYIALYSYDEKEQLIIIQTIRHTRELVPSFLRFD